MPSDHPFEPVRLELNEIRAYVEAHEGEATSDDWEKLAVYALKVSDVLVDWIDYLLAQRDINTSSP